MPPPHLVPPPKLTEGLPDLESIHAQRSAYVKALEDQERQALAQLDEQRAQQVEHLRLQGEAQKKAYALQVDQQVQHHDLALTQEHSENMMVLNQQYSTQRGILEHQANSLVMDFQQKKAHENMLLQQYNLQREMHDSQSRFNEELQRIRATNPHTPGMATAPALAPSPSQGILGSQAVVPNMPVFSRASQASYTPPVPYMSQRPIGYAPAAS